MDASVVELIEEMKNLMNSFTTEFTGFMKTLNGNGKILGNITFLTEGKIMNHGHQEVKNACSNLDVLGRNVLAQSSSHQEAINLDQNTQGQRDKPNRILLVTIHHMLYPITMEVLHQVFFPRGIIEKIVISQESAEFQAFIQYQLQQNAVFARTTLHGRNIYDGCCQLDIQFSNIEELKIANATALAATFGEELAIHNLSCGDSKIQKAHVQEVHKKEDFKNQLLEFMEGINQIQEANNMDKEHKFPYKLEMSNVEFPTCNRDLLAKQELQLETSMRMRPIILDGLSIEKAGVEAKNVAENGVFLGSSVKNRVKNALISMVPRNDELVSFIIFTISINDGCRGLLEDVFNDPNIFISKECGTRFALYDKINRNQAGVDMRKIKFFDFVDIDARGIDLKDKKARPALGMSLSSQEIIKFWMVPSQSSFPWDPGGAVQFSTSSLRTRMLRRGGYCNEPGLMKEATTKNSNSGGNNKNSSCSSS